MQGPLLCLLLVGVVGTLHLAEGALGKDVCGPWTYCNHRFHCCTMEYCCPFPTECCINRLTGVSCCNNQRQVLPKVHYCCVGVSCSTWTYCPDHYFCCTQRACCKEGTECCIKRGPACCKDEDNNFERPLQAWSMFQAPTGNQLTTRSIY